MIEVSIDQESMREIKELRRRHHNAVKQLATTGNTAVTRMLAFASAEIGQKWEERSPYLTGTLSKATREQVFGGVGKVFIDPTIENPILGGYPSIYGPVVHRRKPWVQRVFVNDVPRIVTDASVKFFGEIDREYKR